MKPMKNRGKRKRFSPVNIRHPALTAILLSCAVIAGLFVTRAQDQPAPQLNSDDILNHLNAAISWYRQVMTNAPSSFQPSDAIYRDTAQTLAAQAVRLAFQSAQEEAELITPQGKANSGNASQTGTTGGQGSLSQAQAKVSATISDLQSQIDSLNNQVANTAGSKRKALLDQRARLQGELQLNQAMLDAVQKLTSFESSTENASKGLQGNIQQLKRSVPEVFAANTQQKPAAPPVANTQQGITNSSGLIGQAWDVYRQVRAMHSIDQLSNGTDELRNAVQTVRKPLHDALLNTLQRGRTLAGQAGTSNQAGPNQNQPAPNQSQAAKPNPAPKPSSVPTGKTIQQQFADITNEFKQLADASVPLAQELVILDQSRSNLYEWRQSMMGEFRGLFEALLIRVVMIAIALALILVLSEVWRRFTFRYVHDARRRRQFLILRRFVIGFLITIVLILGFVSEFSSLATFAGFLTAGIAVSLQAVLLSVAAYFFLIGRSGLRIGDRISVSGVTGDVVEIGLVRLYVMELAGSGADLYPTGRIVVLSNSVLFQATTPLYKQIPGAEYSWHVVAVDLNPSANYKLVQDKLVEAVDSVYSKYREQIERQHGWVSRSFDVQLSAPKPQPRLQFSDSGIEIEVRFPVDIRKAADADEEVTRKVIDMINGDEELKKSVAGSPKMRAAVRG